MFAPLRLILWGLHSVMMLTLTLWIGGFLWFLHLVPNAAMLHPPHVDAIVILTGGGLRINEGLDLLQAGQADKLLISGVGEKVGIDDILKHYPVTLSEKTKERMYLGYSAKNTIGNADEAAVWVQAHNLRSLLLVTADYHVPRALLEFHRQLPEVSVYAHPVFATADDVSRASHVRMLIQEYHKYFYRRWMVDFWPIL
jgi:uncharacterized SAM-binding protein YcdF (DUF218 family)